MIVQFARYIDEAYAQMGHDEVTVHAYVLASLNSREPHLLIDPDVNLLWVGTPREPAAWIMPLP